MSPSRSWRCCINAPDRYRWQGMIGERRGPILSELVQTVQPPPHLRQPGRHGLRRRRLRRPFGRNRYAGCHALDDIGLEPVACGAPFGQRKRREIAALGDERADEGADDLVRAAEWDAAANEVVGYVGSEEQAGCRRRRTAAIERQPADDRADDGETAREGIL